MLTSFEPGGTERQMIELVRRLDRSRWRVHVACFRARGAWFGRVAEAVESVAVFPVYSFKSPGVLRQMSAFAHWCRSHNIAVVHTAALPSNVFGLPAAALARVPVRIGNRREINPDKSAAAIALQRAAYTCAHAVVANSRAA
ncbi:MAG TPA: glycosyltransferase, partial [Candidatus Cybelea sp.]|nr:glycosyltransferase [Candidatus Cybelea sp.]